MITRENYEEYFLLYIDNELTVDERKLVESFARDNSDLGHELHMMQQLKLQPENIFFEGRESLLKPVVSQGSSINHTNYEEYFILYTDGELSASQQEEVEAFLTEHPALRAELDLFNQAHIEPDETVVFEGKEILYKKEEPARRVALPWFRMTAAAIILLVAGFLVFRKAKTPADEITAHTTSPAVNQPVPGASTSTETKNNDVAVTKPSPDSLQHSGNTESKWIAAASIKKPVPGKRVNRTSVSVATDHSQQTGITEEEAMEKNTKIAMIKPVVIAKNEVDPISHPDPVAAHAGNLIVAKREIAAVPLNDQSTNYLAQQSIATPIGNPEDDLIQNTSKKPRMRGFFRKVTRVFEKTANVGQEDGKNGILIGSFQIAAR